MLGCARELNQTCTISSFCLYALRDPPGDILAAPESALSGWKSVILSLSIRERECPLSVPYQCGLRVRLEQSWNLAAAAVHLYGKVPRKPVPRLLRHGVSPRGTRRAPQWQRVPMAESW